MSVLTDPSWTVPPLPPGDGPMDRFRRAVSRFAAGPEHADRRAATEALLAGVDPAGLRAAAAALVLADPREPLVPRVPLTVLAAALGIRDAAAVAERVPAVAAAYFPPAPGDPGPADAVPAAEAAVVELLERVGVVRVQLLVQAAGPVAELVRAAAATGDLGRALAGAPPVPMTRRWRAGETVVVPLAGTPFGAGPRRCPAEAHALALAAGVLDGMSR